MSILTFEAKHRRKKMAVHVKGVKYRFLEAGPYRLIRRSQNTTLRVRIC